MSEDDHTAGANPPGEGTPPEDSDDLDQTVDLVARAKGGDSAAFEVLMERYHARVHRIVRARMGGELRREAESLDMVQEAMVDVCAGFDRFEQRSEAGFVNWLATVVENKLREQARFHRATKRESARRVSLEAPDGDSNRPGIDPEDSADSPSQVVAGEEQQQRLRSAVEKLPEGQRRAIELRNAGLEWGEVAERLELASADAARMLHSRAKVALLRALKSE